MLQVEALEASDRVLVIGESSMPQTCIKSDEVALMTLFRQVVYLPAPDHSGRLVRQTSCGVTGLVLVLLQCRLHKFAGFPPGMGGVTLARVLVQALWRAHFNQQGLQMSAAFTWSVLGSISEGLMPRDVAQVCKARLSHRQFKACCYECLHVTQRLTGAARKLPFGP